MDEAFWSNVVKRWSEASESVIKLKEELSKLQEERDLYRDVVQGLRKSSGSGRMVDTSRSRASGTGHTRQESGRTIVVDEEHALSLRDELKDAEIGLVRAKEEYRRLQKELAEANEKIHILTAENNSHQLRNQQQEARDEHQQRLKLQQELMDAQSENRTLVDQVHRLEQAMTSIRNTRETSGADPSYTSTVSDTQLSSLQSLEGQVDLLNESLKTKSIENEELRLELEAAEEKLHKAEERNKATMDSIMRLQDITRHSSGTLHALPADLWTSTPRSRKTSLLSTRSNALESVQNTKRTSLSGPGASFNVENVNVIERHPENTQVVALPEERRMALAKLPAAGIKEAVVENLFDREFLKGVLGSLIERTAEKSENSNRRVVTTSYLCPTLNHHPWCPTTPGQHGYIFVGLGKEKEAYKTPVIRHLFVGLPKAQAKQRRFRYLGQYKVMRVRSLSLDEWNTLSSETKLMYAKLTKDKTKDQRSAEEIAEAYNRSYFNVPCVMLQCLSFDDQLYQKLVLQRDSESQP